jgi:peptidoglycan/xylan/chitin deacetylase (PgdA/CDA1 family)
VPTLPPPLPTVTTVAGDVPVPAPPPLPTPQDNVSRTLKVPILMYHYVSSPPEDADVYRVDLSVEPAVFREQMTYLAANGYSTIDFYDLSLAITGKLELPPRPVIITLDDGYVDNYHQAFPILREFGFKATFFIVTEFIDNGYAGYMNWAMIEEMAAAGMRIESHSKTHPDLRGQEHDYLVWQILGSQETLAAHVGYTPRYFSYPSGQYDEATIAVLQALDFWGAVTTHSGKEHGFNDRYEWTRLRVRYTTVLPEFVDLIDPGSAVGGRLPGT